MVNIGPRERRRRFAVGIAMLAVGTGVGVALIMGGAGRWWRVGVFLPLWVGALGILQARGGT